jgi:hypothetical protein
MRLQAAIQQRNELASYLVRKEMPPLQQSEHACARCFVNKFCSLYHKAVEGGEHHCERFHCGWALLSHGAAERKWVEGIWVL